MPSIAGLSKKLESMTRMRDHAQERIKSLEAEVKKLSIILEDLIGVKERRMVIEYNKDGFKLEPIEYIHTNYDSGAEGYYPDEADSTY